MNDDGKCIHSAGASTYSKLLRLKGPTCKLPMVTQPVCSPKYVLLQHSRLPTRSPAPTARNVSCLSSSSL